MTYSPVECLTCGWRGKRSLRTSWFNCPTCARQGVIGNVVPTGCTAEAVARRAEEIAQHASLETTDAATELKRVEGELRKLGVVKR